MDQPLPDRQRDLIHGRLDMASPLGTAWELARAGHALVVVEDSGTPAVRR